VHALPQPLAIILRDRYLIEREIGRGGMAVIHLARDLKHDRPVALKLLRAELAETLGPERFLREIRLVARLQHPHILPVFDSGEAGGVLWYTMPYVVGESLRERLQRIVRAPVEDAVSITQEVALALDYAHRQGVVHRDIKPENILLADGQALVADFGVAIALETGGVGRVTEAGLVVGTPFYMSPEQATGDLVDKRTDIYALGCMLYEMLAGRPPFTGLTRQAIIAARLLRRAPPLSLVDPGVSVALDQAVSRALAPLPADRFSTAAEFAAALTNATGVGCSSRRAASAPVPWGRHTTRAPKPCGENVAIAVLPLVNLSEDRSNEYLSEGMTEELINVLARAVGLRVAAHTSSSCFKAQKLDVREVGQRLGVGAVIEGSIRVARKRLRVTVQLINVTDGYHLWAESYDRRLDDVLGVQEELAQAIAAKVKETLLGTVGGKELQEHAGCRGTDCADPESV
jgi:serine/threonine protein kinase